MTIFWTPVSWGVWGFTWILSIILTLGASRIVLGIDNAHCMPQIERGLIYIRDRKCPSVVQPSGVWNEYLHDNGKMKTHKKPKETKFYCYLLCWQVNQDANQKCICLNWVRSAWSNVDNIKWIFFYLQHNSSTIYGIHTFIWLKMRWKCCKSSATPIDRVRICF